MPKKTKHRKTAGGIVFNAQGRVLTLERDVKRKGKMVHEIRLPKGKIDPGETDEEAAMREVGEESGYWSLEILADLGAIENEYNHEDIHMIRGEHYFLMRLTDPERQGPKFDEGSEEALFTPLWLEPQAAQDAMTFASERDFIAKARAAKEKLKS